MKKEIPQKITKLLVNTRDSRYLSYIFGQYAIYIENITAIFKNKTLDFGPTIAKVRYDDISAVEDLIATESRLSIPVKRLFKTLNVNIKRKTSIDSFIKSVAKSAVHLVNNKTVKVYSDKNKSLQKKLYDAMVDMNIKEKTKVQFDFDKYDWLLTIKDYEPEGRYWVLTFLEEV